mgnify:CR=1 FL=1|jgi:hypothetical protein
MTNTMEAMGSQVQKAAIQAASTAAANEMQNQMSKGLAGLMKR